MNSIVLAVLPKSEVKPRNQNPNDPRYEKPRPILYRRDSLTQLANNDTRRYIKDKVLPHNIKIDEAFASIRKFIFEKYKTINRKERYGNLENHN